MGSCEHSNEPSVSREGGEFLDPLSDYHLLKQDSALLLLLLLLLLLIIIIIIIIIIQ
jgi:hypothetical protein